MTYLFGQMNDDKAAKQICEKLARVGVRASIKRLEDGSLGLYVEQKEDVAKAHDFYRVSLGMPPRFEVSPEVEAMARVPFGQATGALIGLSLGVALMGWLGDVEQVRAHLMISNSRHGLPEVMQGQWWRLLSPAILHFGFIHLLFNMLWLKSLGSIIELTRGKIFLFSIVVISALFSNLMQWWFKGPLFGGMSGVVYALLGFLWLAKTFNPAEKFSLPRQDVIMMIGWFVLCLTGLLGPIANYAHGAGLAIGMFCGILAGMIQSREYNFLKIGQYLLGIVFVLALTWFFETFI
jgi:GlpG protein